MLGESHRLAAVRGELAHRAGNDALAVASYRLALERCANEVERGHLRSRLAVIGQAGAP
jgi:predicted RNA polymerase sigma factor